MDRYSGLAEVQELLPRWRTYSAYLVENGASGVLQDIGTAEDSGGDGDQPSGIGSRMETYIAEEIFPACLDWLRRQGVSEVPAAHSSDALPLFHSARSCLYFPEEPWDEARASHEPRPQAFTILQKQWHFLARSLGLPRRPRSHVSAAHGRALNAGHVKNLLRHNSDLILLCCLAHQAHPAPSGATKSNAPVGEPRAILEALAALAQTLEREAVDARELQDGAHELVQRFRDYGYESKVVEEGAPYHETMRDHFDIFGHIEPGQPVKTIKAALLKDGMASYKGTIRRLRPSQEKP